MARHDFATLSRLVIRPIYAGAIAILWSCAAAALGPLDYTNPEDRAKHLKIVEQYHFTLDVETLQSGVGDKSVWNDLDYTLRVFPNHHRALAAMSRLLRMRDPGPRLYGKPPGRDITYYFERAVRFAPQDGTVQLLYAIDLHDRGKYDEALIRYKKALDLIPDSADAHYNLGLLYTDMGRYESALDHARKAYALGHRLPGLRNKLRKAGIWPADTAQATGSETQK